MHQVIVRLGGLTVYSHGFLIILAVIVATAILWYLVGRARLPRNNLIDNISTVVLLGVVGSRIAYGIIYHSQLKDFWQIFYIWQGGLVSWGGFIVGLLAMFLLLRSQKQPILKWLDIVSLVMLIGLGIGRIGCYLTGDIPGIVTARYPAGFPVAGLESILCLAFFTIVLVLYFKTLNLKDGLIFFEVTLGYSLIRFIVDGFRDSQIILLGLNWGQIVAAVAIIILLVMFVATSLYWRKNGK